MKAPPLEKEKGRLREQPTECISDVQAGSSDINGKYSALASINKRLKDGPLPLTPPCNTGVEHGKKVAACRVGVDHITFAGLEKLQRVTEFLIAAPLGGDPEAWEAAAARHGYEEAIQDPALKWVLYYGRKDHEHAFCLQLHGKGCGELGLAGCVEFADGVFSLRGIHCTRIDFCVDLLHGRGRGLLDKAEPAVVAGRCSRAGHQIALKRRITPMSLSDVQGDTLYLGSRTSEVFGRWYDKGLESATAKAGETIRLEIEFKKHRANSGLMGLLEADDPVRFVAQHVLGAFEFRVGDVHLDWFSDLMQIVGQSSVASLPGETVVRSFERWSSWMRGRCSPIKRLAAIAEEFNLRKGGKITAGQVLDLMFKEVDGSGRKVRDEVTMAGAAALVEIMSSPDAAE